MAGFKVSIGADSSKAERELSSFERKTRSIAKSIQKGFQERIGHKLFDGLASAARAVPGLLNDAIDSASALNEEISKSETIFGSSSREVQKWAKGAADSMGLSEVAALEATGTIGNMFTAMGMTGKESAEMSKSMVQLASDLGSFNNTSTDDAIQAIGAALRGESEPIRRYGVLLDDATLKAEAFSKGLYDGKGSLDPATRALSAYSVILKQTTAAQGDFQKTSDGLANSKKILAAQFKNASAEIGKALLPAMNELVSLMRDIDWQELGADVGAFAEGFISLTRNVGDAYNSFKDFAEQAMIVTGILDDLKKDTPDMSRFAGEFDRPEQSEQDKLFDRQMKDLMDLAKEKKKVAEISPSKGALDGAREERETVFDLIQKYKELTAEKVKAIKADIRANRKSELASLSMREAQTLADFGMGQGQLIKSRVSELMKMGIGQDDASNIAGREANIERLYRAQDLLSSMSGASSNLAVSSMQRIGGGGGVYSDMDLQRRQTDLQEKIVSLLDDIKKKVPGEQVSDF